MALLSLDDAEYRHLSNTRLLHRSLPHCDRAGWSVSMHSLVDVVRAAALRVLCPEFPTIDVEVARVVDDFLDAVCFLTEIGMMTYEIECFHGAFSARDLVIQQMEEEITSGNIDKIDMLICLWRLYLQGSRELLASDGT